MTNPASVAIPPDPGVIGIELGVELLTRAAPAGIAWLTQRIRGKKILVVGQPRAGKTSFVTYFQYGVFTDPNLKSPKTRRIKKSAAFTVAMGNDQALKLQVGKTIDTVGQVSAEEHVRNVMKFKPNAVIVVLDLTSPWRGTNEYSAGLYLDEFCLHLSERLQRNKAMRKKLRTVMVILNKKDAVRTDKVNKWIGYSDKTIQNRLTPGYGARTNDIPIMPCTLVRSKEMGQSADAIISNLALSLN